MLAFEKSLFSGGVGGGRVTFEIISLFSLPIVEEKSDDSDTINRLFSIHLLRVECTECLGLMACREFQESQALQVEMVSRGRRVTWERKVKPEKLEQSARRERPVTMTLLNASTGNNAYGKRNET